MKIQLFIYSLLLAIVSCDVIESPYSVNTTVSNPDTACIESSGIDTTDVDSLWNNTPVIKKVLLEDHTGHRCQGCPAAHDVAENLNDFFQDSLVVLTVHAGFWTSLSGPFTYDFTTPTGDEILSTILPNQSFWPIGTVNRKDFNGFRSVAYNDWGSKIDQLLDEPAKAIMVIMPSWNSNTRSISAEVKTKFVQSVSATCRLSVYYMEDSIVNWQAFPSPTGNVPDYVHRHVLRGALNGTWGNVLAVNPASNAVYSTKVCGGTISADIDPVNVYLVAILSDEITKEIIQVEEIKLLP